MLLYTLLCRGTHEYIVIIRPCNYYVSWCNHGLLSNRSRHFATSETDWPIFNQWPWIVLRRVATLISHFSLFYSLSLSLSHTHIWPSFNNLSLIIKFFGLLEVFISENFFFFWLGWGGGVGALLIKVLKVKSFERFVTYMIIWLMLNLWNCGLSSQSHVFWLQMWDSKKNFSFNFGFVALKVNEKEMNWIWVLCLFFLLWFFPSWYTITHNFDVSICF